MLLCTGPLDGALFPQEAGDRERGFSTTVRDPGKGSELNRSRVPIIGVAGGIGSGKSMVASLFAEMGARVIDADRLNHEVLDTPEVCETLRATFGDCIVNAEGMTDRDAIRKIVRDDAEALRRLENVVHPRIAERTEALLTEWQADPEVPAIVWDAPLLFELGLDRRCDVIVFVEADPAVRRARTLQQRPWAPEDFGQLEKKQKSLDLKRSRADYIVDNNSSVESLRPRVKEIFSQILSSC